MKKTKILNRVLAVALALVMCLGLLPMSAFAAAPPLDGYVAHDTFYYYGSPECYLYLGIHPKNPLVTDVSPAENLTVWVGEKGTTQRLYTNYETCGYCNRISHEETPEWITVVPKDGSEYFNNSNPTIVGTEDIVWSLAGYVAQNYADVDYAGLPALTIGLKGAKPGYTTLSFSTWQEYCYSYYGGYCDFCGNYVSGGSVSGWAESKESINVTVKARYALIYDTDGGSSISATTTDSTSESATLNVTSAEPTKTGYTFKGWKDDQDNTYAAGQSVTLNWSEGLGSVSNPVSKTLTAQWTPKTTEPEKTFKVTYTDGVENEIVFADQNYEDLKAGDSTLAFVGDPDVRDGYTFKGWTPTWNPVVSADDAVNGVIVYTATWEKNPEPATYTIVREYYANDEKKAAITGGVNDGTVNEVLTAENLDKSNPDWRTRTVDGVKGDTNATFTLINSNDRWTLTAGKTTITLRYQHVHADGIDGDGKCEVCGDCLHNHTAGEDTSNCGHTDCGNPLCGVTPKPTCDHSDEAHHCDHEDCGNENCKPQGCVDEDGDGKCDICGECTHTANGCGDECNHDDDCQCKHETHVDTTPEDGKCDICGECTHDANKCGDECNHDDKCQCKHQHVDKNPEDGKCDDEDCGECLHTKDPDTGHCTDPDCTHGEDCACGGKAPEQEEETYTVTFCANGGVWADGSKHDVAKQVKKGSTPTVPSANPTREGYTFNSWIGGDLNAAVEGDVTFYATWTAETVNTPAINAVHALSAGESVKDLKDGYPIAISITLVNSGNTTLTGLKLQETMDSRLTLVGTPQVTVNGQLGALTAMPAAASDGRVPYFRISSDSFELKPSGIITILYNAKLTEAGKAEVNALSDDDTIGLTNTLQFVLGSLRSGGANVTINGVEGKPAAVANRVTVKSYMAFAGADLPMVLADAEEDDFWGEDGAPDGDDLIISVPGNNPGTNPGTDPEKPGTDPEKPGTDPEKPGTDPEKPGTDPTTPTNPTNPTTPSTPSYDYDYEPPYTPSTPSNDDDEVEIEDEETPLASAIGLNNVDHMAYIAGYTDGTVRPTNYITRAEVATIFFRLMTDVYRATNWSTENDFTDVAAGSWYNTAISTISNAGIMNGDGNGTFRPDDYITRAEFTTTAARFLGEEYDGSGVDGFSDIAGHWAEDNILRAAQAQWVNGDNGKFRPNDYISRAEVMTIVNRMLNRLSGEEHMLPDMVIWPDNPKDAWYYEAVQEATNEHSYDRDDDDVESWEELLEARDWAALEAAWAEEFAAK